MTSKIKIGIIGGSGLDDPDILEDRQEKFVETPFGKPSDALIIGKIKGVECILLARHGRKHSIDPTHVNYRANIHALKAEGCNIVVVTTAVGSLREEIHPGEIVLLDQFIDRTYRRKQSFYDGTSEAYKGVCHIPMDTPFSPELRKVLQGTLEELDMKYHPKGTIVIAEGPRFSTKAESFMFRSWGATVISMTTVPEVCLAKEAGLLYVSAALVTDYDVWRETGEAVNVEGVLRVLRENSEKAKNMLLNVIPKIGSRDWSKEIEEAQRTARSSIM